MTGNIQLGDVATWVGGIATSLAFLVTYLLLRARQKEFRASEHERRERDEDRRKDQARFVSAWVVGTSPQNPASTQLSVNVQYRNGSEEPIFGCNLYALHDYGPDAETTARAFIGVVPPHGSSTRDFRAQVVEGLLTDPPIEIRFTDSRGRHWRRRHDGQLIPMNENPDNGPC